MTFVAISFEHADDKWVENSSFVVDSGLVFVFRRSAR